MSVKRWDIRADEDGDSGMSEDVLGYYVEFKDYAALEAEVVRLRKALSNLMPMLAECDCIYSNRADPPCPCRAARNALSACAPQKDSSV